MTRPPLHDFRLTRASYEHFDYDDVNNVSSEGFHSSVFSLEKSLNKSGVAETASPVCFLLFLFSWSSLCALGTKKKKKKRERMLHLVNSTVDTDVLIRQQLELKLG